MNVETKLLGQICITGATGFIGRQLVENLSKNGNVIRVLTRNSQAVFPSSVEVVIGDLTKPTDSLSRFVSNCDVIFHCAGEINDIKKMKLVHLDGTKNLIRSALNEYKHSGKKIHWVQLSSCGAYGPPSGMPETERIITEQSATCPVNEYELTKIQADELVMAACGGGEISFSILRPSNVFGAKMTNSSLWKLISMVKVGHFFYLGKKGSIATYVHVNDVVRALMLLATDDRAKNQLYNLSSDCTLEELVNKVSFLLNVDKPSLRFPAPLVRVPLSILASLLKRWKHIPRLDMLILRTRYSTDKIESELSFTFSMPMPNAIEDLTKHIFNLKKSG